MVDGIVKRTIFNKIHLTTIVISCKGIVKLSNLGKYYSMAAIIREWGMFAWLLLELCNQAKTTARDSRAPRRRSAKGGGPCLGGRDSCLTDISTGPPCGSRRDAGVAERSSARPLGQAPDCTVASPLNACTGYKVAACSDRNTFNSL